MMFEMLGSDGAPIFPVDGASAPEFFSFSYQVRCSPLEASLKFTFLTVRYGTRMSPRGRSERSRSGTEWCASRRHSDQGRKWRRPEILRVLKVARHGGEAKFCWRRRRTLMPRCKARVLRRAGGDGCQRCNARACCSASRN